IARLTGVKTNLSDDAEVTVDCYLDKLVPSKDAAGTWKRDVNWALEKTVDPSTHTGFAGESAGSSTWTVVAKKIDSGPYDFKVSGSISIDNPASIAQSFTLSDELDDGTVAIITCDDTGDNTGTVPAGGTVNCTYIAYPEDASATLNTVTASAAGNPDQTDDDPVEWTEMLTGDDTVTLDDDRNPSGFPASISYSTTINYEETFTCSDNPADYTDGIDSDTYPNIARLTGVKTNLSDDAEVTVDCYAPVVSKTAEGKFDKDWDWTIDKVGDQTELTLEIGQSFTVLYNVVVDATSEDFNYRVEGTITVVNPNPGAAMEIVLTDALDVGGAATITGCTGGTWEPSTEKLTIAAAGTAECTYEVSLGDTPAELPTLNTATAALNGIDFVATAKVGEFVMDNETDQCITVTDDHKGILGKVCVSDGLPHTFSYALEVGRYVVCGDYDFVNVVTFVTNDNFETDNASWTVQIHIMCDPGCTLTQGYWKTHANPDKKYDPTWDLVGGPNAPFFDATYNTGLSWINLFNTPPSGGNAYIILAHQYMAARLNMLSPAYSPDYFNPGTMDAAETLLKDYATPVDGVPIIPKDAPDGDRAEAIMLAEILDKYNNGFPDFSPGHCDDVEDSTSYNIGGFLSEVQP
ncbi:MAG: hypothetical protein P1S60_08355, partial [Anaerolineae bacterium]|nr:hypothetical protein [Anaerolineae bacterium]